MIDPTGAAYALLLGAVAAFNPCGFALLPAYVTVLVTRSADARVPRAVALRRAVGFGTALTLGFLAVFTSLGLLFGLAEVLPRWGVTALDPVLTTTARWQGATAQWIESWGPALLIGAVAIVAIAVAVVLIAARRAQARTPAFAPADAVAEARTNGVRPAPLPVASQATLDALRNAARGRG